VSSEATPSALGSYCLPRVNRSRVTLTYFIKIDEGNITRMRARYQIPDNVVFRIPPLDKRVCCPKFDDVAFYEVDFQTGLHFPLQPFVRELLDFLSLALGNKLQYFSLDTI
jgi:hypothetical protein